jgi:general secretion pathway protein J
VTARAATRPARGFTLVEVLIAVAITAFIGMVIAGAFAQLDRSAAIVRDQQDRMSGVRLGLARMTRELSMAFLSEHYDRARYRDRPTLFKGQEDEVLFTTMSNMRLWRDVKESDQAVVEYTVDRDPATGKEALFRRVKGRIDDEPDRGGRTDLVADHVTRLSLRYWDLKRKDWVRDWSTRDSERLNELPSRIRIELEVETADGRRETFSTQARLAITTPLDF